MSKGEVSEVRPEREETVMSAAAVAAVARMLRAAAPSMGVLDDVAVVAVGREVRDAPYRGAAAALLFERGLTEAEVVAFVDAADRWIVPVVWRLPADRRGRHD